MNRIFKPVLLSITILISMARCPIGPGSTEEIRHHQASCRRESIVLMSVYPECLKDVGKTGADGEINTKYDCDYWLALQLLGYSMCNSSMPDGQKIYFPDSLNEIKLVNPL